MSNKTFDRHTICVACRGSDCDIDHRCEECTEWPEEELLLYVKHRCTLKSKRSKPKTQAPPPPPPAAPSVPSSHPAPCSEFESQLELLASQVSAVSELFTARLTAPQAIGEFLPASHAPSQARLESDARCPHPVETAGHHQESQALGGSGRETDAPGSLPYGQAQLGGDLQASAGLGWASPSASPLQAPRQPPLSPGGFFFRLYPRLLWALALLRRLLVALQVGHPRMLHLRGFRLLLPGLLVILGPRTATVIAAPPPLLLIPLPLSLRNSSTTFALKRGRCSIPFLHLESWFDPSPASSSSWSRVCPRVPAVESEVADRAAALHRRSKPLSAVLPRKIRRYVVADQPLFAAPQPVNPSFSRLAGASAVGSKRWGSLTFAEMERLERLFRCQLEATSSSLWMMSGILAMLKRDGFNPSTPGLFNTAISSVSAYGVSGGYSGLGVGVPSL